MTTTTNQFDEAVRPQTPHRSPWQAFGGNFSKAYLRQAEQKKSLSREEKTCMTTCLRLA